MANLYIAEFGNTGKTSLRATQAPEVPPLAQQVVSFTASTACTNAFNTKTHLVRLNVDADCFIEFGVSPTATTSSCIRMIADQTEYFAIRPEVGTMKVAAYDGTS